MQSTLRSRQELTTLEREIITAGIVWLMVAGICVVIVNVWAAGMV